MEIAGNCLYLQFRRARTGPCGCGCRFMLGFASPALPGTENGTDQRLRSARTCGRCREQGGLPRDKAAVESFSPERSREAWAAHLPPEPGREEGAGPPLGTAHPQAALSPTVSSTSAWRDSFCPLKGDACLQLSIVSLKKREEQTGL